MGKGAAAVGRSVGVHPKEVAVFVEENPNGEVYLEVDVEQEVVLELLLELDTTVLVLVVVDVERDVDLEVLVVLREDGVVVVVLSEEEELVDLVEIDVELEVEDGVLKSGFGRTSSVTDTGKLTTLHPMLYHTTRSTLMLPGG